jgi:hypothetical protein
MSNAPAWKLSDVGYWYVPGPLSSPSGSETSRMSWPGTKSNTIVRCACAVAPPGLTATTFSTLVPPVIATSTLKAPLAPAIVVASVVAEFASVFVAAT